MIELVADKPLLLLFLVSGVGYVLGKLKVAGFSLGISAVLFAGLAASAIDERLKLPEIIYELGLVLFVYTIAVASGPGFVSTLKRRGVRDNLLALSMIVFAFAMILIASVVTGISGERSSGLFAGALTNTPALVGVVEHLKQAGGGALAAEPVVAYSLAYPWGVIGPLLAIFITQRWWRAPVVCRSRSMEGRSLRDRRGVRSPRPRLARRPCRDRPVRALRCARSASPHRRAAHPDVARSRCCRLLVGDRRGPRSRPARGRRIGQRTGSPREGRCPFSGRGLRRCDRGFQRTRDPKGR
ncbi:MAG: hypothetical protein ABI571_07845 [Actinomycetota bacterium]